MKKFLFAAILFAGTTYGFAKNNVKSTEKETVKVEHIIGKTITTYQFNSLEEAQKFLKDCTVVTAAFTMIDGELEMISVCETTGPCILQEEGTTTISVVIV